MIKTINRNTDKMNIKNILKTLSIALFIAATSSASAFGEEFGKFGIGTRLYNFETGTSNMNEVDIAFDSAYPLDLNLTWRFMDNLSLEFSATRFNQEVDARQDDYSGYIGDLTQTPIFLTLRYEKQVQESDLYMYFGLGGAYFINEFDFKKRDFPGAFYGVNYKNIDIDNSFAFTLSLGSEYRFMENYALCADVRLIMNQANFTIDYLNNTTGKEDVGLSSSMFGLGLKYYF